MNDFESMVRMTTGQLDALGVEYALVGGLAVSIWCEPRFRRGVDLVVAVEGDGAAEAVVAAFVADDHHRVLSTVEQHNVGRLAVAQDEDLEVARQAVGLIESRGYQRGRDLTVALADLVRSHAAPEGA
ncbi:MAG: hypothetical protein ABIW46_04550 [Acidimicrobiales bacterium]